MSTSRVLAKAKTIDQKASDDFVFNAATYVRQMIAAGEPRASILSRLVAVAEIVESPGVTVSILVLDRSGLLRNGSSPSLPADYLKAIDGLRPDPDLGTCASAAATGLVVLTPDFHADEKWKELRHWPMSLGYVGAWSQPIKSETGQVLGTFGTYYRTHRTPTIEERRKIQLLADAAALVLA